MKIYCKHNQIVTRDYTDFTIVYNLYSKKIILLENVASEIWNFIYNNEDVNFKQIINHIGFNYDIHEGDINEDVINFIEELLRDCFIYINETNDRSPDAITEINKINSDTEGEIIQIMQNRDQIFSATFELTYSCNEKCVHCYATYPTKICPQKTLDLKKCKELIDELHDMGCCQISFTGGDPFMFEGFVELFKYARNKNFVCDVYTNGQAIANNIQLIDEISPLFPKVFYISLYGSTSEIHDSVTQVPGSFDKTIISIKILSKFNIPVVINVMMLKINCHQIDDIIKLASYLNVQYRIGLSIINKNNGDTTPNNYFINEKTVLKKIISTAKMNLYNLDSPIFRKINKTNSICGAGTTTLCIAPDGEVYPCVSLKTSLGSVFKTKLSDIWNSSKRKSLISSLVWSKTIKCNKCHYLSECPHCVGISQAECGDPLACNTCDYLIAESIHELNQN